MQEFKRVDTTDIQESSLVNFMAALGYEPTYKHSGKRELLAGFFQPKFARVGKARLSVNTAIRLHNNLAEDTFAKVKSEPMIEFKKFVANEANADEIVALFAGTCKIVEFVNATYSNRNGFRVHKHDVKFMTNYDRRQYGF
jgi:hypothetical protein